MNEELDARIAKFAMKLEIIDGDSVLATEYPEGHRMYNSIKRIPNYSTDMNLAMAVIENSEFAYEIISYGRAYRIRLFTGSIVAKNVVAVYTVLKNSAARANNTPPGSLPLTICLAELRAKGDGEWVDAYLKLKEIEDNA